MENVQLPRALVNQLLRIAQASPEREVCGLIGSDAHQGFSLYPVANVAEHPQDRFIMEPKSQIDAMRIMRESGEKLFAIYHSHPHAPASPSPLDRDEAAYPDALYLIISLNTEGVLELSGFRQELSAFRPVNLLI